MRLLSVIVPVFDEEKNLPSLYERLNSACQNLGETQVEFVFVDDHSGDAGPRLIAELATKDSRVKLVRLSRNFGSHAAIRAGLDYCTGDAAGVIAADLQDPPEILPRLLAALDRGADIVWACPRSRQDPPAAIFCSRVYYRLMKRWALPDIWPNGADVFLINRKAIAAVRRVREKNTNVFALLLWSGFRQTSIEYDSAARRAGVSKWSVGKKLKLVTDSFVSFSLFPLRLISGVGLGLVALGLILGLWLLLGHTRSASLFGFGGLFCLVVLLAGVQLVMLGIVAAYLWRAFDENRGRPLYMIEEVRGFADDPPSGDRRESVAEPSRN